MRVSELDGLRGIAILGVLAVHATGQFVGGWLGMDIFFALSGYLITLALMRDGSLARFYGRRIARIWPPLVGTVALAYVIAPGFEIEPLAYFYANFVPAKALGSLDHTWYLSIEEQFYLVWPLAFLFVGRIPFLIVVIAAAWGMHAWMAINGADVDTIYRSTFSRMDALAVGCGLALLRPKVGKTIGYAALAMAVLVFFTARPAPITVAFGLALYPFLCVGLISASRSIGLLRLAPLRYLGTRSWGIYLYHYPIFYAMAPLHHPHHPYEWVALTAVKLTLAFALAEISHRTIEKWALKVDLSRLLPSTDSTSSGASR